MCENPHDQIEGGVDEFPNLAVLVIDSQHTRWAADIDDWNAATLLACISEDPADWSELAAVWPRYQAGPSAEFADALPLAVTEHDAAVERLPLDECWMVLDLQQQRVFSSPAYGEIRRDGCFGIESDEGRSSNGLPAEVQMSIHLPPWWEIHNAATPAQVRHSRETAVRRPRPRRDVLWGPPLARGLAERMLASFQSPEWNTAAASADPQARYRFTVAVHRDWLMSPRDDLEGRTPRESLHGGIDWIERVIEGQRWNVTQERTLTRIPHDFASYLQAPMGRSEVCLYFDLCREMIDLGWRWLETHRAEFAAQEHRAEFAAREPRAANRLVDHLATVLEEVKTVWMEAPFEGGSSPAAIIQDERDRIPQVVGEEGHLLDCDCPLCLMMAEGLFGPTFISFDGHHLELDSEFAFSLWEHREEWEVAQAEFISMAAEIDAEREDRGSRGEQTAKPEDEEPFGSVWTGSFVSDELPGDPLGHLGIGFRVTDLVSELQSLSAPQADLDRLNQAFINYRHAGPEQRRIATEQFQQELEQLALLHPVLISRAADLQSKLDELRRRPSHAGQGG